MDMNIDNIMIEGFIIEQEDVSARRIAYEDGKVKIGATDLTCPRKGGFNIMFGPAKRDLSQSFLMKKGNIAEDMFAENLKIMGLEYETQGDYHGPDELSFIQVHPDFLIDVSNPGNPIGEAKKMIDEAKKNGIKYILIELKTANAIPGVAHSYWTQQVNMQIDYISTAKGIKQEELFACIYAIELNRGNHKRFDVEFDQAEVAIPESGAISFFNVITEFVKFANGEIDEMEHTIYDIDRTVGVICNMCDWADQCFKEKESIELPEDLSTFAIELKEWKEKEKNMAEKNTDIKEFIKRSGVKKATSEELTLSVRGGNTKDELDIDSMTDDEKIDLWNSNMKVFNLNSSLFSKLEPRRHKEMMNKHKKIKTTAESLIIKRNK